MSTVQQAIEVGAPVHTVYEQLASFESYPHFMTGVEEITRVSDTTAHWVMNLDGERREFDAEITECRTDERVAWEAIEGPMLSEVLMLRAVDGRRTHIIAQLDADVQALMPSDAQAKETLNRRLKADLTSFKRYIEGGAAASGMDLPDGGGTMMGSAPLGAGGAGMSANPRSSSARAGNARMPGNAADLDAGARRLTDTDGLDGERGSAGFR